MNFSFTLPGDHLSGLETIKVAELSQILGRSPATIRTQLCREPQRVPPHLPGSWPKVWRLVTVLKWLNEQENNQTAIITPAKRGRGRPRKGCA
jgi:hypothetical protein